jgi:hypothetical protein
MSSAWAPISTPGGGTAKVRSSKPSVFRSASMIGIGSFHGRVVVIDVSDLLAVQVAELVLDELDRRRALRPVGRGDREQIGVARTIGGGGNSEAGRRRRNVILFKPLVQRDGLRRAVQRHQDGALLLLPLIGLYRVRHLVAVVDLVVLDLVPVDPALRVDQIEIIMHRRAQHRADDLRRAGAVALDADCQRLVLRPGGPGKRDRRGGARHERQHAA